MTLAFSPATAASASAAPAMASSSAWRTRRAFCCSTIFRSAWAVAISARVRDRASDSSASALRWASATRASFSTSAVWRRPTESR